MARRRITVDLCTYTQDTANANSSPYCTRKAAFTIGPDSEYAGVSDFHRVCLGHVGHAAEVIKVVNGSTKIRLVPDFERDGGFTDAVTPPESVE